MYRFRDYRDGDVKGDKSDSDSQPNQEWYDPPEIVAVQNETGNPPPKENEMLAINLFLINSAYS